DGCAGLRRASALRPFAGGGGRGLQRYAAALLGGHGPLLPPRVSWRRRSHFLHYRDRKSTRLNSSHVSISYAVFCLKKKNNTKTLPRVWPIPVALFRHHFIIPLAIPFAAHWLKRQRRPSPGISRRCSALPRRPDAYC